MKRIKIEEAEKMEELRGKTLYPSKKPSG